MIDNSKDNRIALPGDIKRTNRMSVLQTLRSGAPVSASDISDETGLSRPTVMKALQEFCESGIVKSVGYGNTTSRGGKKPEMFVFSDRREILCISIWPKEIILSHCGLTEEVHDFKRFDQDTDIELDVLEGKLEQIIDAYLAEIGVPNRNLYGVCINVPGTVDYGLQTINFNVKAPKWGKNIQITQRIKALFDDSVVFFVDNAGKAVARGLLRDNTENINKRLLTIFSSWGISACMIDKGHVLNGRDSLIGEIGHMVVSDSILKPCICGKCGCLEQVVHMDLIKEKLKERGIIVGGDFTFRKLFENSEAGDIHCREMSLYLAHYFAVILHNISLAYNQEIVVFQGDFAWADHVFDEALKRELAEFVYYSKQHGFTIVYDRRDLMLMAARGETDKMKTEYFKTVV